MKEIFLIIRKICQIAERREKAQYLSKVLTDPFHVSLPVRSLYVTFNLYSDPNALEQLQCVAHHENPLEIGKYL